MIVVSSAADRSHEIKLRVDHWLSEKRRSLVMSTRAVAVEFVGVKISMG